MNRRMFLSLTATAIVTSACRAIPAPPAASPSIAAPSRRSNLAGQLLLRQAGGGVTAIDAASGRSLFSLPAGLATSNGQRWVALSPAGSGSEVSAFDAKQGTRQARVQLENGYSAMAISHNGECALLANPAPAASPNPISRVAVANLTTGAVREFGPLPGHLTVDTLNDSGSRAFLIAQHPETNSNAYEVVTLDLNSGQVTKLADKRSSDAAMSGYRVGHVWTPDAEWLYSLYLDPGGEGAFVHALNVVHGFAACIDLPAKGQPQAAVQDFTLALAPTQPKVFATSLSLGSLSSFGVNDFEVATAKIPTDASFSQPGASNNSAVLAGGSVVFAGSAKGILAISTTAGKALNTLLPNQPVLSLALAPDEKALLALSGAATKRIVALDPGDGNALSDPIPVPNATTAIEQFMAA